MTTVEMYARGLQSGEIVRYFIIILKNVFKKRMFCYPIVDHKFSAAQKKNNLATRKIGHMK